MFIQLYIDKVPKGSGFSEHFPDPTGSGYATLLDSPPGMVSIFDEISWIIFANFDSLYANYTAENFLGTDYNAESVGNAGN